MLCNAEPVAHQHSMPISMVSTGRSFSGSASSMKIRMSEQRSLGLIPQEYASIQSLMGELIDRSCPTGLTGYVKELPRLILTIDGNESITLDSSAISIGKDLTNEKAATADVTFKTQLEAFQDKLGLS